MKPRTRGQLNGVCCFFPPSFSLSLQCDNITCLSLTCSVHVYAHGEQIIFVSVHANKDLDFPIYQSSDQIAHVNSTCAV